MLTRRWGRLRVSLALILLALLAACGGDEPETIEVTRVVTETIVEEGVEVEVTRVVTEVITEVVTETVTEEVVPGATPEGPGTEASGTEPDEGVRPAGAGPGTGPKASTGSVALPTVEVVDAPREAGNPALGDPAPAPTAPPAWQLTAGAVDDNLTWSEYLSYRAAYAGPPVLPADVSERYRLRVVDQNGAPLLGATLSVAAAEGTIATLRTHADGRAYFHPRVFPAPVGVGTYLVTASWNGATTTREIPAGATSAEWILTLPVESSAPTGVPLDVLFLLDATGSMGDEINGLKENVRAIAVRVAQLPSAPDARFGMVAYRDRGETFLTRTVDLTADIDAFAAGLEPLIAAGGRDYPEDLHAGLAVALQGQSWRPAAVKLIVLIADAPPHLDYNDQGLDYVLGMMTAAEQGIKIYPLATSGLDVQGEYIFRQMAQYTGGQFLFLVDEGGAGEEAESGAGVTPYTVAALDVLIVEIIAREVGADLVSALDPR